LTLPFRSGNMCDRPVFRGKEQQTETSDKNEMDFDTITEQESHHHDIAR